MGRRFEGAEPDRSIAMGGEVSVGARAVWVNEPVDATIKVEEAEECEQASPHYCCEGGCT